jgi:hypothetical protein
MLREIQRKHYLTSITSIIDKIHDWFKSPPIQEPVPNNMTAKQDIKWLMAWWRTNHFKYPQMAKIAHCYLSVPISDVGIERLFSHGRNLQGLRQYALQPATIKMLTVLKAFQDNKSWLEVTADIKEGLLEDDVDIDIMVIPK